MRNCCQDCGYPIADNEQTCGCEQTDFDALLRRGMQDLKEIKQAQREYAARVIALTRQLKTRKGADE